MICGAGGDAVTSCVVCVEGEDYGGGCSVSCDWEIKEVFELLFGKVVSGFFFSGVGEV